MGTYDVDNIFKAGFINYNFPRYFDEERGKIYKLRLAKASALQTNTTKHVYGSIVNAMENALHHYKLGYKPVKPGESINVVWESIQKTWVFENRSGF